MSYIQTRSSSGGCSVAVVCVPVSAPKCGNVEDTAQSRAGVMDDEVQGQRVARLGALDGERAGHRIEERERAHQRRQVVDRADRAAEAVLGGQPQDVARAQRWPRGSRPPNV